MTGDKRNFMLNFIIPQAVRILSSKIQINSTGQMNNFTAGQLNSCKDGGNITISSKYNGSGVIDADFLYFVGSVNEPSQGYLAYASYCVLGNFCYL